MKTKVFIGFGANRGDMLKNVQKAVSKINTNNSIRILTVSSIYQTKPFGGVEQENFINGALLIETDYYLNELFVFLKDVENEIGRKPSERWGPREIDLDILIFGEFVGNEGDIQIPHKGILERDFVIIPILEIDPDIILPGKEIKLNSVDLSKIEKNVLNKIPNKIAY